MTGLLVGCAIPLSTFGRLSVPTRRLRFRDGFIRFCLSRDKQRLLAVLVDKEDKLLYAQDPIEACLKSERLGTAVQLFLSQFNQFEAGEHPGVREQVLVSV